MAAKRNIRTWIDIEVARDDDDLSAAEDELIEACQNGWICTLGDGSVPMEPSAERNIGADLLRYLITGGCEKAGLHEQGVWLFGAYIEDNFDLDGCSTKGQTFFLNCYFAKRFYADHANIRGLRLDGCEIQGGLWARGARIDGDFSVAAGQINSVLSLSGATINGSLDFSEAKLIKDHEPEFTLHLENLQARELKWTNIHRFEGFINLSGAQITILNDDFDSWQKVKNVSLDQFQYRYFKNPLNVGDRLNWLAKDQSTFEIFRPQIYQQLARVYGEQGQDSLRRRVLLEKERLIDQQYQLDFRTAISDTRKNLYAETDHHKRLDLKNQIRRLKLQNFMHSFARGGLRRFVGYGYSPQNVMLWGIGAIVFIWLLSCLAMVSGGMVPNSDIVMTSKEWRRALDAANPTLAWLDNAKAGQHYETFQSFAYAVDVVVPLVPLEQETNWTPTTKEPLGKVLWVSNWFAKAFGWILTGLGAATITGHVRRD